MHVIIPASLRRLALLAAMALATLAGLTGCNRPPKDFAPVASPWWGGCPALAGRYAFTTRNGMAAESVFARAPAFAHVLARPVGATVESVAIGPVDGGLRFTWESAGVTATVSDLVEATRRQCSHGWLELPTSGTKGPGTLRLAKDAQGWLVVAWRHPDAVTLPGWCGDHCDTLSLGTLQATQWWRFAPASAAPTARAASAGAAPTATDDRAGPLDAREPFGAGNPLVEAQLAYVHDTVASIVGDAVRVAGVRGTDALVGVTLDAATADALAEAATRLGADGRMLGVRRIAGNGGDGASTRAEFVMYYAPFVSIWFDAFVEQARPALLACMPPGSEAPALRASGETLEMKLRLAQPGDALTLLAALDRSPLVTLHERSRDDLEAHATATGPLVLHLLPRVPAGQANPLRPRDGG